MRITQEQHEQGQEFYRKMIVKAWEDSDFKQNLIKNPLKEIEKIRGKELPFLKSSKIIIDDQTDESKIFLNIPRKVNSDNLELSDEQLEAVAGGEGPILGVIAICCALFGSGIVLYGATHKC